MKKRLLCLPLVATMLGGCSLLGLGGEGSLLSKLDVLGLFTKKGTTDDTGGSNNNNTSGGNNNTSGGGGGGGQSTSGDATPKGTLKQTLTLSKCTDMTSEGVFSKNGYTVTITQGECAQTVAEAVNASQSYEFRIYAKMQMACTATSAFKGILVTFYNKESNGKTYYFDFTEIDGATNNCDASSGKSWVELDSAGTSLSVNCWHQTRVASVAFYA